MIQKRYFPLLALAFLFLFTACRKETPERVPGKLTAAQYLQKNAASPIIFHFSYTNEDTQERNGWFIDKWGALKTYQTSLQDPRVIPEEEQCGAHLIDNLYALANVSPTQIDLEILAEKFKLIDRARYGQLSDIQSSSDAGLSVFYAFQQEENYEENEHCYDDNGELVDVFNRVLLKSSGKQIQDNLSQEAQEILNWLLVLQEDHNL